MSDVRLTVPDICPDASTLADSLLLLLPSDLLEGAGHGAGLGVRRQQLECQTLRVGW